MVRTRQSNSAASAVAATLFSHGVMRPSLAVRCASPLGRARHQELLAQAVSVEMPRDETIELRAEAGALLRLVLERRDELHDGAERLLDALSIVLRAERGEGHRAAIEKDVCDRIAEPLANHVWITPLRRGSYARRRWRVLADEREHLPHA